MFRSSRDQVRTATALTAANARQAAIKQASFNDPVISALGPSLDSMVAAGLTEQSTSEELSDRYSGWVYAATQPIVKRIAERPVNVARVAPTNPPTGSNGRTTFYREHGARYFDLNRKSMPAWIANNKAFQDDMGIDIEPVPGHAVARLLADPNELMVRMTLLQTLALNLIVSGKGLAWVRQRQRQGKIESTIWPVPAHRAHAKPGRNRIIDKWVVTTGFGGNSIEVPAESMLYFPLPDPFDPITGTVSPVEADYRTLLTDEAMTRSWQSSMTNLVKPGTAVFIGEEDAPDGTSAVPRLTPEQREELTEWLVEHYQGALKHGMPIIFDALIRDVKHLDRPASEMDYLGTSKAIKERITQMIGTNPIVMGQVEGANRASSVEAERHICNEAVNPILSLFGQVMTKFLGPLFAQPGETLIVWFEPCHPNEREMMLAEYQGSPGPAVLIDEYRRDVLGLEPLPGGAGNVRLESMAVIEVPADGPKPIPEIDFGGEEDDEDEGRPEGGVLTDDRGLGRRRFSGRQSSEFIKRFSTVWLKQHSANERRFATIIQDTYQMAGDGIAKLLARGDGPSSAEEVAGWLDSSFDTTGLDRHLRQASEPEVLRMMMSGAAMAASSTAQLVGTRGSTLDDLDDLWTKQDPDAFLEISLDFDLPPEVVSSIRGQLDDVMKQPFWRKMSETTKKAIGRELLAGIEEGEGIRQIAKRIRRFVRGPTERKRSLLIARTEVTGSQNAGNMSMGRHLQSRGIVQSKRWVATIDDRTRKRANANHINMDGVTVTIDEKFEVLGGGEADMPGDYALPARQRVACRCTGIFQ